MKQLVTAPTGRIFDLLPGEPVSEDPQTRTKEICIEGVECVIKEVRYHHARHPRLEVFKKSMPALYLFRVEHCSFSSENAYMKTLIPGRFIQSKESMNEAIAVWQGINNLISSDNERIPLPDNKRPDLYTMCF